ncbi:HNH endonuclease signature motif containing protein [Microbacterium sp. A93]|uniref:HNH endonuclease signature motif containing protein n=1 Tax=Microbacterium sp. A93 TaxID=3450716 RepID=UPI003F41FFC8
MGMTELLEQARRLTAELARRALDPSLLDSLERIPPGHGVDPSEQWGLYAHALAAEETAGPGGPGGPGKPGDSHDAGGPGEQGSGGDPHVPAGSLPVILTGVEELGRWVDAARTGLAGHVDRVFESHTVRLEVLGVPPGKCAYRHGADYLWQVLGIHRAEAKRRVVRASRIMGTLSLARDHVVLPPLPVIGEIVRQAQADPGSVDLVGDALMDARQDAMLGGAAAELIDPLLVNGERVLADFASQSDPASVKKAVDHWRQRFDALVNPDGAAPSDAQIDAAQGLYYHGRGRAKLHRWTVLATDAQHERLKTVVSAASTLRNALPASATQDLAPPGDRMPQDTKRQRELSDAGESDESDELGEVHESSADPWRRQRDQADSLDGRSRAQRELDGLVSALTGALALTGVDSTPSGETSPTRFTHRIRPQMLVTIDFQTLAQQYEGHRASPGMWDADGIGPPPPPGSTGGREDISPGKAGRFLSEAAYSGPVDPTMIRQLACEADLVPVVLGGRGEVLDVGRSQRLFSRRLRQAITARDGGCAAPDCSIPAPWCEAHHIQHWQHGGPTSVQNGVLLCSHHHHAVHSEAWEIRVEDGVPWFIPARYQDPEQRPRRNRFWRPGEAEPQEDAA